MGWGTDKLGEPGAPDMTNRTLLTLVIAALLLASCDGAPAPTTTTTTAPPPTTTIPGDEDSQVYDLLALATHPNGAQLRVDRVEVMSSGVVVSGGISNGSPFELRLGGGTTELVSESGAGSRLLSALEVTRVAPAEDVAFTLRFQPLEQPESVTLVFNSGGGSSPSDPTTSAPAFTLGPIHLDPAGTRPSLPEPVPVSRTAADAAGVEVQVEGINFTENRIGVWVRISNPLTLEARIAPTIAPTLLEDDLGNRYPLVLGDAEGWISIPAGTARSGSLTFAGRIHPQASALNMGINAGSGSRRDQNRIFPELIVRTVPLSGDVATAPLPLPLTMASTVEHPAGVRIDVAGAAFSDTGTEVGVVISNDRADTVALAAEATLILDDLDNRYPLVPLPDNPRLVVEANTVVEATLAFSGRIADEASEISLIFNAGLSDSDPETRQPAFAFGPHAVQRPDITPEPVVARVFAVGDRSRLVEDELAVSQVDQITQTLEQFGATEVDGGFQLTLPDSILFDFGSDELRPDALQTLTLIAEVLLYFEDAPVIVVGHTDSIGSAAANQRLSEQRAQSVVDALVSDHGIPPGLLTPEGRGASEPIAPNTTEDGEDNPDGRALNRRVELVVLTDQELPLP